MRIDKYLKREMKKKKNKKFVWLKVASVNISYIMVDCVPLPSGKSADIEEFRSLVKREKGDNYKNRHGATVIS